MGRVLIGAGCVLICLGVVLLLLERFHFAPGRLPGDIVVRSRGLTVYFPVVTCILLSAAATLLLWLLNRR